MVFPGSPIEWYFRAFAPDRSCLRLAYASIVGQFKGIHVLVESLSHLKRMGVPFRCEIAGDQVDTELLEKLKEFLAHHELSDCVDFIGFQDKAGLASLFARSNVLVFPSVFEEPFGKTQIEAMAAGLLVVSSGTGGTREIVQHGENGLVFDSGNAESLAAELKSLVDNEDRWRQLAANGQSSAFNFTTKRSVDKLEEIFDSLLERE